MKPQLKITKAELLAFNPCSEGRKFIAKRSLKNAWLKCSDPQWMIWELSKFGLWDERLARTFAIKCAEHTLHLFEEKYPDDKRPRLALQAAQDFQDGKISNEARSAARSAAESAAQSAAWSAAWSAVEEESKWQADTLRTLINPFKKHALK